MSDKEKYVAIHKILDFYEDPRSNFYWVIPLEYFSIAKVSKENPTDIDFNCDGCRTKRCGKCTPMYRAYRIDLSETLYLGTSLEEATNAIKKVELKEDADASIADILSTYGISDSIYLEYLSRMMKEDNLKCLTACDRFRYAGELAGACYKFIY